MPFGISRRASTALALLVLGTGLAAAPAACTSNSPPTEVCGGQKYCQTNLTILHTGDVHSRLFAYDLEITQVDSELGLGANGSVTTVGGVAQLSYVVQRERARANRVMHLNAGDWFEGAPIFNYFEGPSTPAGVGGQPEIQCASAIGTDAMALGNHEFDFGPQNAYRQIQAWADFPVLAANYQFYDQTEPNSSLIGNVVKPFTVLNEGGLKVAVIGMGNLSSLSSIFNQPNSLGILPLQTEETAQFYVDLLRPYVDLVVVLSHLGIDADEAMVQGTTGIDIVAGGHNHIVVDPPQVLTDCSADPNNPGYVWAVDPNIPETPGGTPPDDAVHPDPANHPYEFRRPCKPRNVLIMQSGAFSKYVGELNAVLSNDPKVVSPSCNGSLGASVKCDPNDYDPVNGFEVVSSTYQAFPIDATLPQDPVIVNLLQPYQRELDNVPDLTILAGFSPLGAKRTPPEDGDSALGNLVSTSMWLQLGVQTDFSLTNTSGIRTDLNPGVVPISELFNIFPFANTITTMELSAVEIRELFDFVARRSQGRGCESQAQIAGARVTLNCTGCDPTYRPDAAPTGCNQDSDCSSGAVGACNLGNPLDGMAGTCLVTPCAQEIFIGQQTDQNGNFKMCSTDEDCADPSCKGPSCQSPAKLEGQCVLPQGSSAKGLCWSPLPLWDPSNLTNVYSLATNNYIAAGGSGFKVLQRNTTQVNTNILQRDALIDYMREGNPCGYVASETALLAKDGLTSDVSANGLLSCSTDSDCQTPAATALGLGLGYVCECPGNPQLQTIDGAQSCVTNNTMGCGTNMGQCIRQDCRDQVAQYLLTACQGVPSGDTNACQKAINACSTGGEECKYLSCVDATEFATVDGRITVIQ
jgi:5'-nucleotidase / UDP-sugar diphosphatase